MYHARFKGSHYEMGKKWGAQLFGHGKFLMEGVPFPITKERIDFVKKCRPFYEKWYPEILEEIRGIAEGQQIHADLLEVVLLSMYCIMPENKCTCFAFQDGDHMLLARNSDFLTEIEKLYMNCIYKFNCGSYSFQGNTTAFVEMEDGMNEQGLAIGFTSVYPKILGYGLNAGMLVRFGLEKCSTTKQFIEALKVLPIASSQTFTVADNGGRAALIECNAKKMEIQYLDQEKKVVHAVNSFHLSGMKSYRIDGIDDWNSQERYETIQSAFRQEREKDMVSFAMDVLAGKYGFTCQYDRKTGKDTVWSVVYDVSHKKIYRCEGNPSRRKFVQDSRTS